MRDPAERLRDMLEAIAAIAPRTWATKNPPGNRGIG